ncbi:MAG: hypothetical protein IJ763_02050 [Lachnospiraceae bacterium]|nr:hypothetical protein [Lachnospiraceae bacterium]
MFKKKKKTYIDKINFDLFTDDNDEFDLFDYDSDDETETDISDANENLLDEKFDVESEKESKTDIEEDVKEESDTDNEEEIKEELDSGIEEHDENIETENEEEPEEAETEYEEEQKEDLEEDTEDTDKKIKDKKKKSKGKIAFWIIFWILLFSSGVLAFLYFKTDLLEGLFDKKDKETTTVTEMETTDEPVIDESFKTIYSYETNANIDINALMADYYDALVKGDKDKLKDIVTEPDAFGDMVLYETKSQVISEYSNITCYTIPGLKENEILVFTTSNLNITGVTSKPLDIQRFYVVDTGSGYKINNGVLSQETIDYINLQTGSPDVQALYKSVQENINQCLAEDTTFADFMNKISTNTDAY